jgi:hypothetical protein
VDRPAVGVAEQVLAAVTELALPLVPAPDVLAQGVHRDRVEREDASTAVRLAILIEGVSADLDGLAALGYTIRELVLDAADFGHAQHRRRLFIVATRDGVELDLTPPAVAPVTASQILDPDPGRPVTRRLYVADQIDSITDEAISSTRSPRCRTAQGEVRARHVDGAAKCRRKT